MPGHGDTPRFGSAIRVIGGRFSDDGSTYTMTTGALSYENSQNANVVFRCVFELPTDPAGVVELISPK
jgi:hypothetical protein